MGLYDSLYTDLRCPRCGALSREQEIEFRFGPGQCQEVRLGDALHCTSTDRAGYVECRVCSRDYWVTITIEDARIASVWIDWATPGYVP